MSAFIRNNLGKLALSSILVLILVAGMVLFGSFNSSKTLSSAIVEGGTGNYPYWSTPCIYAPFATSGKGYWCSGYNWGTKRNDSGNASVNSPYGYGYRNCTDYVAWKLNSLGVSQTLYQGLGNAKDWGNKASKKGVTVNNSPAIGAVAVDTIGQYGHVAFVVNVNSNGTITVSQYNKGQDGNYSTQTGTPSSLSFSAFIHLERYETSHISENLPSNQQISTLAKPSQTNTSNGSGNSTTTQTYNSAKPATSSSPSSTSASSTNGSTNSSSTNTSSPPLPPVQSPPPPPPPTFSETVGGNAHTWTDYSNAGGNQGSVIPSNTTVQIACKVTGFKVADGDTWWYRIASSPWNNNYYVSADAFYNNGQTSGSLKGTPFVDNAVPDC